MSALAMDGLTSLTPDQWEKVKQEMAIASRTVRVEFLDHFWTAVDRGYFAAFHSHGHELRVCRRADGSYYCGVNERRNHHWIAVDRATAMRFYRSHLPK